MKLFPMLSIFITTLMFSCADNTTKIKPVHAEVINNQITINPDTLRNDSSYVYTGFYFLADDRQGIKMLKDHSHETYNISQNPFVSIKTILRASAQKIVIQGHDTYNINLVLDNEGTKYLEKGTGDPSHPYIAVVIANRLLFVVENTSKMQTGIMQIALVNYSEKEVDDMIDAINQKR